MAKYVNRGRPPGSYVAGYPFFYVHDEADFPPDVVPSKGWVALDEEAVKAFSDHLNMQVKINNDEHVREFLTAKPAEKPAPETEDQRTLADFARSDAGIPPKRDEGAILTGSKPSARGRASDKTP